MKRFYYLLLALCIIALSGCRKKSKIDREWDAAMKAPIEDRSNVFYEETKPVNATGFVTAQDDVAPSEPTPGMKRIYQAEMDREEDVYEEAYVLAYAFLCR